MALGGVRGSSTGASQPGGRWLSLLSWLALWLAASVAGSAEGAESKSAEPSAEPRLGSVVVEATVEPGRPLLVTMSYFLHPEQADSVSFTALTFEGSRAVNVRAFVGERELSFRSPSSSERESRPRLKGRVDLPPELSQRERFQLRLRYEVLPNPLETATEATLLLPLLVAEWPPAETRPTTFVAVVRLPRDLQVLDSFPSEYEVLDSVDAARATESYRLELPVVPALLRLRAASADASRLTLARAFDWSAALALVALSLYGWRRVRGHLR